MDLKEMLRIIPDFPKPGINFIDITTLLKDGEAMKEAFTRMKEMLRGAEVDILVGPEARGFLVALLWPCSWAPALCWCASPQIPAKSWRPVMSWRGHDTLQIHKDVIRLGTRSWWWMTSWPPAYVWSSGGPQLGEIVASPFSSSHPSSREGRAGRSRTP